MDYKELGTGGGNNAEYPKRFLEDEKIEDNFNYIETKIKRRGVMNEIKENEEDKKEEKKEEINAEGKNENNNEEIKNTVFFFNEQKIDSLSSIKLIRVLIEFFSKKLSKKVDY